MLAGLMHDDFGLTVDHIRRRLAVARGRVLTARQDGSLLDTPYVEIDRRVHRLAHGLSALGVGSGDRVATFAWNTQAHLELYLATPAVGAVLHTLNVRLSDEQLRYIANHAQDQVVFVDESLVPALERLAGDLRSVRHYVVIGDDVGSLPGAVRYADLLADAPPDDYPFPAIDERQAASLCYTSGTTGNPKGVLYSHRSLSLHASTLLSADLLGLGEADRVLPVVPMFHVNAWGLPFAAVLAGGDLVLPDRFLQAPALAALIERARPTMMGAVPTVFADLLRHVDEHGADLSSLSTCVSGGAAVPLSLMQDFERRHGVVIHQAWGMTETSPFCTIARPPAHADPGEAWRWRSTQGRPVPWVELRLVDDAGRVVAHDGQAIGEIQARGPWVARRYFGDRTGDDRFADGWLRTGDIASISPDGYVSITDRAKDVIKSGGEWISSVELESQLVAHHDVIEAAVIAKPDERWSERPLCCVVLRAGATTGADDLIAHLRPRVARWWLPDEFAFIEEIPKTSVGKFDKKALRQRLAAGELAGRIRVSSASGAS